MVKVGGWFEVEYLLNGQRVWAERCKNGVTKQFLDYMLSVSVQGGTQLSTWYFGLIANASFSAVDDDDTYASHAGWTETTAYSESVRQTFSQATVTDQLITESTTAAFTFTADTVVRGMFLASDNTKGDTAAAGAKLWVTSLLSTARTILTGGIYRVGYTCQAAESGD